MSIRLLLLALSSKIKEWLELDYMEYSSDANAQAAYVSNAIYDSYTKSLLHFQGSNNSTTFTDETGKVWTAVLNAKISTAQYKFGSSSGLFSGNNGAISDCITSPDSADWDVGNGDFTIDFWIRIHTYIAGSVIIYQATIGNYAPILIRNDAIYMSSNGSSWDVCNALSYATYVADTWTHIAIVRSGNTFKTYQDGTQTNTFDSSATLMNSTASMSLMGTADGVYGTVGNMSEFRFTKGKARWTSDFTPDTAPYPQQSGYGLIDYSESTIKTQGSYALKAVAAATDSLNKTLTKTFSPALDLSGKTQIKFDIRASRTGSNIKLGFHDSGGTTTEVTPNITSADTFQTVTVDISAVADADKDAIDSLIITIVNADSANTVYIDNVRYS